MKKQLPFTARFARAILEGLKTRERDAAAAEPRERERERLVSLS